MRVYCLYDWKIIDPVNILPQIEAFRIVLKDVNIGVVLTRRTSLLIASIINFNSFPTDIPPDKDTNNIGEYEANPKVWTKI